MKPAPFHWHAPTTLDQAVAILAEVAHLDGRVLAGGQSLLPAMALRIARPPHLVDINRVAGLDGLQVERDVLRIGALVRHAAFHRVVAPGPLGALLKLVTRYIAHAPIRQRGTPCGSLCHADPAAEWPLLACVLGATLCAQSSRGERRIAAEAFLLGPLQTDLASDEILTAVELPLLPGTARCGFVEISRRAGDFAQAMALAVLPLDDAGRMQASRIGVGAVEALPRRLPQVEALLDGQVPDEVLFLRAANAAAADVVPMEDAMYRRSLTRTTVLRALRQAFAA